MARPIHHEVGVPKVTVNDDGTTETQSGSDIVYPSGDRTGRFRSVFSSINAKSPNVIYDSSTPCNTVIHNEGKIIAVNPAGE